MTNDNDGSPTLLFEVLGPIRVRRNGQELDLGPRQQRLILALLLARIGEPVGIGEIVSMLWGSQPPSSAVNIVHRYVGNLRRLVEPTLGPRVRSCLLVSDAAGYRLLLDEKSLDVLLFRRFALEARAAINAQQPGMAMAAYSKALELWRGPCAGALDLLAEQSDAFDAVDRECARLAREAADLSLSLDGGHSVLQALRCMATSYHFDEALQAKLMLILSAAGQQADAIAIYHSLRRKLTEELGIDPGAELRAAYRQVLQSSSVAGRQEKEGRRHDTGSGQEAGRDSCATCSATASPDQISQSHYDGVTHTAPITVSSDDIGSNGRVRSSKYLDYSIQARWAALADAGLSIKELASAGLGPVELDVSIKYMRELVFGDEIDVVTRFEYPSPKIVRLVQSMVRRSDGAPVAVVTAVTGLMDLASQQLVDNAAAIWADFLRDLAVVGLASPSEPDQPS
ncbi:BTAD domain-containing putative transcriptional regulator [Micromonospora sp. CPCC 205558]|uniref:BTAD domain-containing putative transcriptional regulator n=1 Tax=Micromonospora sp. CPCC 205558 TaxID=3122403 RepID=UPI002FF00141